MSISVLRQSIFKELGTTSNQNLVTYGTIREAIQKELQLRFEKLPVVSDKEKVEGTSVRFFINDLIFEHWDSSGRGVVGYKGYVRFLMNDYVDNNVGSELMLDYVSEVFDVLEKGFSFKIKDITLRFSLIEVLEGDFAVNSRNGAPMYNKIFNFEVR